MTNGDKIRSMTDEELAKYLEEELICAAPWCDTLAQTDEDGKCVKWNCDDCALEWVKSEWVEPDNVVLTVQFNPQSKIKLKPCPRCGAVPAKFTWGKGYFSIRCPKCGMYMAQKNYAEDETDMAGAVKELKELWNK